MDKACREVTNKRRKRYCLRPEKQWPKPPKWAGWERVQGGYRGQDDIDVNGSGKLSTSAVFGKRPRSASCNRNLSYANSVRMLGRAFSTTGSLSILRVTIKVPSRVVFSYQHVFSRAASGESCITLAMPCCGLCSGGFLCLIPTTARRCYERT